MSYSGTGLPGIGGYKPEKMSSGKKKSSKKSRVSTPADRARQKAHYEEKTFFKVGVPEKGGKGKIELNKGITSLRLYETDKGKTKISIRQGKAPAITRTINITGRSPSAYNKHIKSEIAKGATFAEAAKSYRK